MLAGLRDILIISHHRTRHVSAICWATAASGAESAICGAALAGWLAQAFIIGRDFIGDDHAALVLATTFTGTSCSNC